MTNIRDLAQDEPRGVVGESQLQTPTAEEIFEGALQVCIRAVDDGELMTFGTPDGSRIVVIAGGEAAAAVAYALSVIVGTPDDPDQLELPVEDTDNDPED